MKPGEGKFQPTGLRLEHVQSPPFNNRKFRVPDVRDPLTKFIGVKHSVTISGDSAAVSAGQSFTEGEIVRRNGDALPSTKETFMNRKLIPVLLGATLAAASGFASAHSNVSFGLYVGAPAYSYAPAPVYYAPVPVYYPGPAYYRPVYYGPAVRYYGPHHRGWHRHHRHHRR